MSYYGQTDFATRVSLGLIPGWASLNKFGQGPDCDNGIPTDLWDGADGTTSTDVWVAPTVARIHNIASTAAADDGDPVGTGMRTVRIYYLKDWDTAEASEDVILNGVGAVAMSNACVIIHRMKGLTFGSGGTNAGIITATAVTDATVTAAIQIGYGQTEMAIYGVPSTKKFALHSVYSHLHRTAASGTAIADGQVLVKENADQADSGFVVKNDFLVAHNLNFVKHYPVPPIYTGPCVIKLQATSDTNNATITGSFSGFLVDN